MRSAQALGPLLGARVRIGSEASEGCFRREAAGHGILHLGTHAEMNATDPMYARLVFSKDGEGLDPDAFWQVHRGVLVRASAVSRAQRDDLGRITLHLKQHAERLPVSQAYAWRFKPM